jgi:hypothetical protein
MKVNNDMAQILWSDSELSGVDLSTALYMVEGFVSL